MGIFENTILVNKRVSVWNMMGRILSLALCITTLLFSFLPIAPLAFLVLAILLGAIYYMLRLEAHVEYEYSYIEGRLSFAKIKAKRKRKELARIEMEELLVIAPEGSPRLAQNYGNVKITRQDYTSGNPNADRYEAVFKHNTGIGVIVFEPTRNVLELMRTRYADKIEMGGTADGR